MNALAWAFDFNVTFLNVFLKSFAFVADLNLWTSAILNTSSDILKKFCMLFDDVSSFCDDDKCLMFNLKWTFDLVDTFINIWLKFQTFVDDLNLWTFDFVDALSSILIELLALNTDSSLETFINSKTSLNILSEFRMLIDSASLFYNDDKSLMFNVDAFS